MSCFLSETYFQFKLKYFLIDLKSINLGFNELIYFLT